MYSRIRRETSTLRKHWYLQWKTHIFSPRTHRRRMKLLLNTCCCFSFGFWACVFVRRSSMLVSKLSQIWSQDARKWTQKWAKHDTKSTAGQTMLPTGSQIPICLPKRVPKGSILSTLGAPNDPNSTSLGAKSDPEGSLLRALVPQSVFKRPFGRPRHLSWRFLGF